MAGKGVPIKVGSIIHLENGAQNGGYLDTRGRVTDKPDFWNVAGTERVFVSTHGRSDRDRGSGSWKVISADGKPDGEPLRMGDTIHLLNMYPDAGYLDCCGWVEHLLPFKDLKGKVTCGVFTSCVPDRDNGTGKWIIRPAGNKNDGDSLCEGDPIALDNGHPNTGSLVTHGRVTDKEIFKEYEGQQFFVFTSAFENRKGQAGTWTITLSSLNASSDRLLFDFFRPELLKGGPIT